MPSEHQQPDNEQPRLTDDDLTKLATMLADYGAHADGKERAPNGTPVRLYIADDIVSQAGLALLADAQRARANEAALRVALDAHRLAIQVLYGVVPAEAQFRVEIALGDLEARLRAQERGGDADGE